MIGVISTDERRARLTIIEAACKCLAAKEEFWQVVQSGERFSEDSGVRTLACLGRYFTDRGRGVLKLGESGFDWEAEIILRTIYECAAKILLLALVDDAERASLVNEYWELAPESSDRKTARKAVFAETVFPKDHASRDVFRILQDDRFIRDSGNLNKAARRALEHKWSFSEIVERLAQMDVGGNQLQGVRSLLHVYGVASHLAHADHAAMELMLDRTIRPKDELVALRTAHVGRIATDVSSLGMFCAHATAPLAGLLPKELSSMRAAHAEIVEISSKHHHRFEESQQSFYDQIFNRDEVPSDSEA